MQNRKRKYFYDNFGFWIWKRIETNELQTFKNKLSISVFCVFASMLRGVFGNDCIIIFDAIKKRVDARRRQSASASVRRGENHQVESHRPEDGRRVQDGWSQRKAVQRKVLSQLRRYQTVLEPSFCHLLWTEEEEKTMYALHDELGNKWAQIAQRMPGRYHFVHSELTTV